MIPYGRQEITPEDIQAVTEVLKSDFLTQGPTIPRFEAAITNATGAGYAVAVNSATSALHIACLALGLGPGDSLWTVPNTFVASANVGLYCGAEVDFVDIDSASYVMCVSALEAKLERAAACGGLPKIVMPVQFAGQCADMVTIAALAKHYGFRVIEDASHAIGASYAGEPVGSGRHSDITVFSFHPVKIVTTAEGGVAATNDPTLADKMALLRSHGVTREERLREGPADGPWSYEQVTLGFNYRMTDLQAALGCSQMQRLGAYIARRHAIARRYEAELNAVPVTLPYQRTDCYSALHLFPVQVKERTRVFEELRAAGIGVNVHYIPVHTQPFWRRRGFDWGDFPNAEKYYQQAISLPLYPGLSAEDQECVIAALRKSVCA